VGRRCIGLVAFAGVKVRDVGHPLGAEVGPQILLAQETVAAAGQAHDAHIGLIGIGVKRALITAPVWIHDAAGEDVHPMAHVPQRQGDFFDINQLSTEIGVLGPIAVLGIKVPLRVQKGDSHVVTWDDLINHWS
jgi:hypothetical protein